MAHPFDARGTFVAIITPFKDGAVDTDALRKHVDTLVKAGVSGVVPVGTTGESPTLTHEEDEWVIRTTVEEVAGRVPVMAGTGSNSTRTAVRNSMTAEALGADGLLVVTPYYNKPTQPGLYLHYKAIAEAVSIPVTVYDIPGRTAVVLEDETLRKLSEIDNLVSLKAASGDLEQIKRVIQDPDIRLDVLSGDDGLTLEIMRSGATGVVSVLANLLPAEMSNMTTAALEGDFDTAQALDDKMRPLMEMMFIETNPIPIKSAVSFMGGCRPEFRLPLCPMQEETQAKLRQALIDFGLELKE